MPKGIAHCATLGSEPEFSAQMDSKISRTNRISCTPATLDACVWRWNTVSH